MPDADYNNWFENMFKTKTSDRCAITSCKLLKKGCGSAYTEGRVSVSNKVDPKTKAAKIEFLALTNEPKGYTEELCV